ncbi:MAG: hypothetical protein RMJ37_00080 [Spirochaetia bacterium]|nr:hypothetical protein [Spirochaetota bacterium]MCX8096189.1 hypothetical protein [Spirochaetota bacterium]MDW8111725.1 hypothetical protein [Spirochaetia bacterium]
MNFVKLVFVVTLSLVILISTIVIYYDTPRLRVENVNITHNIRYYPTSLDEKISSMIRNENILALDKPILENTIKNLSEDIKDARVLIYPPNTVHISVIHRKPIVKVFTGRGYTLYDEDVMEVKSYDKESFDRAITIIPKTTIRKEILENIIKEVHLLDEDILVSKYFPNVFITDRDGIYGFNSNFKINIYFGEEISREKLRKAFLSTRYIVQKKLPVRYVDARYENIIAN